MQNYLLTETYVKMIKERQNEVIKENINNTEKMIRFIMPVTIDYHITQDDIELKYPYEMYVEDIQKGTLERIILKTLVNIIEQLAYDKIKGITASLPSIDIQFKKSPTIKDAQFYRFSLDNFLENYKNRYNEEQNQNISKELS